MSTFLSKNIIGAFDFFIMSLKYSVFPIDGIIIYPDIPILPISLKYLFNISLFSLYCDKTI